MRYRAEIDGLRAVAVLPVILFHAAVPGFSGGFVGVDVFFVISGYLITGLIVEELQAGRFTIAGFYARRARRILPALFTVMLVTVAAAWMVLIPRDFVAFMRSVLATTTFSSNILFWQEAGYFDRAAELKPLLHTWSLAVEEQYYILFPPLMILLWKLSPRRLPQALGVLAVLSLFCAWQLADSHPDAAFYLLPARGWELLAGALLVFAPSTGTRFNAMAALLGMVLIVVSVLGFDRGTAFPYLHPLLPVLGTVLVIAGTAGGGPVRRLLSWRPLVGVGLISYSAYLWHYPLFALVRYRSLAPPGPWLLLALAVLALGLAALSWRYIENPFRGRRAVAGRPALIAALCCAALLIGASVVVLVGQGGPAADQTRAQRSAALDQAVAAREQGIRAGRCHYNEAIDEQRLAEFLARWDCAPGTAGPGVLVFGDSHAADKAMALRAAGLDPAQLTAAGCPLHPDWAQGPVRHCARLFAKLQTLPAIDTVLLSGRLGYGQLQPAALQALVDWWSARYPRVILFSPMPDVSLPLREYLQFGEHRRARATAAHDAQFRLASAGLRMPGHFGVIDTLALWCDGRLAACPVSIEDVLLMTDESHLSVPGALRLGRRLSAEPLIAPLFSQTGNAR